MDRRVDGERLLVVRDPGDLAGRAIVLRATSTGRVTVARVEQSHAGTQARVQEALARRLGESELSFGGEWRRARWYEVLWLGDRIAVVTILLTAIAAAIGAVIAFVSKADTVGWALALGGATASVLAAVATVRKEVKKLAP